ncbi:MAG: PAS domain S-box protein [Candidatus Delongbacteria bacterium]|nr:PAS domain S-box protein [Candidatus Delongbacteria bacterium]
MAIKPIRILLVEDDPDHVLLIESSFIKFGNKFQLSIVDNLKDALSHITNTDLIISDLNLPDGNGKALLQNENIRNNIPVIIMTSFGGEEIVVDLMKSGAADYVLKSNQAFMKLPDTADNVNKLWKMQLERKKAEEERKKLSIAMDYSPDAIVITDSAGVIEFVNPSFEKITGYNKKELIGKTPSILNSGRQSKKMYKELWETIKSGKTWKGNFINRKKDGTFYEEEAAISPVLDEQGKIANYVAVKRDISERIQMENQLRHAQKMEGVGTLAAGIAHEINTPLQYLSDNTLFIKDSFLKFIPILDKMVEFSETGSCDSYKINELMVYFKELDLNFLKQEIPQSIEESLNGLKIVREIVAAMKNFSHPGKADKQYADLNKAINSTITITKNVWKFTADIETDLCEKLPEVKCHIGDINQVFLNMITNASDAIAEKGEKGIIKISTRHDGKFVYIQISDTGTGIPDELREKIFQPFFTTKEVGKGTGQGLAISYDIIVNKHNGKIDIDVKKGSGTTFIIKVPIEDQ